MARRRKKASRRKKWIRLVIFEMILLGFLCVAIIVFFASGYASEITQLKEEAKFFVTNSTPDTFKQSQTSIAYDINGDTIAVMRAEKDVYYIEGNQIPEYAKQAFISIEDKKYYEHHGVDYQAIIRAGLVYLREKRITQGASTITQQLAKNIFLSSEQTWQRKVEEIFIASYLEEKYSKENILEFYLNNIYFGNGFYGIQAASRGYFNRDADELSLSEIAFLCAIPNRPTYYDPKVHFRHTIDRRNQILKAMREDEVISNNTYKQAMRETIKMSEPPQEERHNYAETFTYYCATRALMEMDGFEFQTVFDNQEERQNYEEDYNAAYEECNAKLYTGGYRIYTSLDLKIQDQLQSAIDDVLSGFTELEADGTFSLQSAATCIDNANGMVCAIVGGRSQDTKGYTLNRAFQSFRQPGSSIKPLIVYTPALEMGYNASSILNDQKFEGGPNNADNTYQGSITLRSAVEKSKNTVAWKLFEEITPQKGISYLEKMQFSKLDAADSTYLPASIGGFTNGVSTLEMAKGYATLENDGAYRDPSCILKITDPEENVLYEPSHSEEMVYEQEASREMTNILEGVLIRGTAKGLGLGEMPCAAKTGTTDDYNDGWFVGYTRYYTTSVWVGYDTPRTISGLSGGIYPGRIWNEFMTQLHEGLAPRDFLKPANFYEEPEVVQQPQVVQEVTNEIGGDAIEGTGDETEAGTAEEGVDESWEQPEDFVDDSEIFIGGEDESTTEEPVVIPPVDGGQVQEAPAQEQPAAEGPVTEQPVVEQPAAEQPQVETPPVDPAVQ